MFTVLSFIHHITKKIFIMLFMKVNVVAWKSQVCKIFMTRSDIRPDNWRQLQVDKKYNSSYSMKPQIFQIELFEM